MFGTHFLAFLLTFTAFVLLTLITFSVPFVSSFYFLDSSVSGGVRFGVWGWCLDNGTACLEPKRLGYSWDPQIIAWMTKTFVLYPVSAGLCLLSLISLIPTLCTHRRDRIYPSGPFALISFLAFLTSFLAFVFMIALWGVAITRFHRDGFSARFGPLPWMSLAATIALMAVAGSSGCGNMCRRTSPHLRYDV